MEMSGITVFCQNRKRGELLPKIYAALAMEVKTNPLNLAMPR